MAITLRLSRRLVRCLATVSLLVLPWDIRAAPVDSDLAVSVAERILAVNPCLGKPDAQRGNVLEIDGVRTVAGPDGETLAYIVDLQPTGFMIIAGDDRVAPLFFFSWNSTCSGLTDPRSPLRSMVLLEIPGRIECYGAATRGEQDEIAQQWYPSGRDQVAVADIAIRQDEFLQAVWGQSGKADVVDRLSGSTARLDTYNRHTPGNSVAGCVAIAGAQVMRYFRYPPSARGSGNPSLNGNSFPEAFDHDYVYDLMPRGLEPSLTGGRLTLAQVDAVAHFVHDVGIAVNMQYTPGESLALSSDLADKMRTVFGYSSAGLDAAWWGSDGRDDINHELLSLYPVIIMIRTAMIGGSGHCVVLDGYGRSANSDVYHVNMGWGGSDNGWYPVAPGTVPENGYTFSFWQDSIYNIRPPTIRKADLEAGFGANPTFAGGGVYAPTVQRIEGQTVPGDVATFAVVLRNQGTLPEQFRLEATSESPDWLVLSRPTGPPEYGTAYSTGGLAGGVQTRVLKPGERAWVEVRISPPADLPVGARATFGVTATSMNDRNAWDRVELAVTCVRGRPNLLIRRLGDPAYGEAMPRITTAVNQPAVFDVLLRNGPVRASYTLRSRVGWEQTLRSVLLGQPDMSGWRLRTFRYGGTPPLWGEIPSGGLWLGALEPSQELQFRVELTPSLGVPSDAVALAVVTVTGSEAAGEDTIRGWVEKARYAPVLDIRDGATGVFQDTAAMHLLLRPEAAQFQVRVLNAGSVPDRFSLFLHDEPSPYQGWRVSLSSAETSVLGPKEEQVVQVQVLTPPFFSIPGRTAIAFRIEARSQGADSSADWVTAQLVKPVVGPDLQVRTLTGSYADATVDAIAGVGQPTTVCVRVTNLAPAGTPADQFILSTTEEGAIGWTIGYFNALTGGSTITADVRAGRWQTRALAPGESQELRLDGAPGTLSAGGSACTVRITARSQLDSGRTDTVAARLIKARSEAVLTVRADPAAPYQDTDLTTTIRETTSATFYLQIRNRGQAQDSLTVWAVSNVGSPPGWGIQWFADSDHDPATPDVSIPSQVAESGVLQPGDSTDLRVVVTPPAGVREEVSWQGRLRAVSANDVDVSDAITVTARRAAYQPEQEARNAGEAGFGDTVPERDVGAGGTVVYEFQVTNDGSAPDTLSLAPELTAVGGGEWSVTFFDALTGGNQVMPPAAGGRGPRQRWTIANLAPGETRLYRAEVRLEAGSAPDSQLDLRVDAVSLGDPTRRARVLASAHAADSRVRVLVQHEGASGYLTAPLAEQTVGSAGEVTWQFAVRNEGNAPDGLRVLGSHTGTHADQWAVRYFVADETGEPVEITAGMISRNGHLFDGVAPGGWRYLSATVRPDAALAPDDTCQLTVRVQSVGVAGVSDSMTLRALKGGAPAPVVRIRPAGGLSYSETEALGGAAVGTAAVYEVVVSNPGTTAAVYTLTTESEVGRGFEDWQYTVWDDVPGGGMITGETMAGRWVVGPLAPGAEAPFRIEVAPLNAVAAGETYRVAVRAAVRGVAAAGNQVLARTTACSFSRVRLEATPASPQGPGTDIVLTAVVEPAPAEGSGAGLRYRFVAGDEELQGFTAGGSYTWHPTVAGLYELRVVAKDVSLAAPVEIASPVVAYDVRDQATRWLSPTCSSPGVVDVVLNLDWRGTDPVSTLTVAETLPADWQFGFVYADPAPSAAPEPGATGAIEFRWDNPVSVPPVLQYRVNVPAGASGTYSFAGTVRIETGRRGVTDLVTAGSSEVRVVFAVTEVSPATAMQVVEGGVVVEEPVELSEGLRQVFTVTATGGVEPYRYFWTLGGSPVGDGTSTLTLELPFDTVQHPDRRLPDQALVCRIVDSSGRKAAGGVQVTAEWPTVRVSDWDQPAPAPGLVTVAPAEPKTGEELKAMVGGEGPVVDLDGDEITGADVVWLLEGSSVLVPGMVLPGDWVRKGDTWYVQVACRTNPYGEGEVVSPLYQFTSVQVANTPPVAVSQPGVMVERNGSVELWLTARDPDAVAGVDALTYSIQQEPLHGTLEGFNADTGFVTYRPSADFAGVDQFSFRANDGSADSFPDGWVTVFVHGGWLLPLGVTNAGVKELYLGVEAGATAAFEEGTDLRVPASPLAELGYAALMTAEMPPVDVQRDIRGSLGDGPWRVFVMPNPVLGMTVSWDRAGVPAGGLWLWQMDGATLEPVAGSAVDMRVESSVAVPTDAPMGSWYEIGTAPGLSVRTTVFGPVWYLPDLGPVAVDPGLVVVDAGATTLSGAVVRFSGLYDRTQDVLGYSGPRAISAGFDAASGTLTLTGDGDAAAYQAALRAVTYTNTGHNSSPGVRPVEFAVFAGAASSTTAVQNVVVAPVGSVVRWGTGAQGATPLPGGLDNIVALAGGGDHWLALRADRTVFAFGSNDSGQATVPGDLSDVVAIAAGTVHSLALKRDGTVRGWGGGSQASVPAGLNEVTAIAAGGAFSMALKRDGTVVVWGDNSFGQKDIPPGLTDVVAIAAGVTHCLALDRSGYVHAWGNGADGRTAVPEGLKGVLAIAAGFDHSLALTAREGVVAWGGNSFGQRDVPTDLGAVLGIAAGRQHSLAVLANGTVRAWGLGDAGQTTVPGTLQDAVAVAAGSGYSLALRYARVNRPPVADAGGPYVIEQGSGVKLAGGGSLDPDAPFGDTITAYAWDLDGDGQFDDATGPGPELEWAALLALGVRYPADPVSGLPTNRIGLRVTDGQNATGEASTTLTIYDARPFAVISSLTPSPAEVGQRVTFDGSGSHHGAPGHRITAWLWRFGAAGTGEGETATFVFSEAGDYEIGLRVQDDLGATSAEVTRALRVNPGVMPLAVAGMSPGTASGLNTELATVAAPVLVPEGGEQAFTVTGANGAGPGAYHYAWQLAGAGVGADSATFRYAPGYATVAHPARQSADMVLACTVTDGAGRGVATARWQVVRVTDTDRLPGAPVVRIAPALPTTADELSVEIETAAVDPDGDAISGYTVVWATGEPAAVVNSDRLSAERTRKGQQWGVSVRARSRPYDAGTQEVLGTAAGAAQATIVNTVPRAVNQRGLIVPRTGTLDLQMAGADADAAEGVDTLSYAVGTAPLHGTLSLLEPATGRVRYAPAADYTGSDFFSFTVADGTAISEPARVDLYVYSGWVVTMRVANGDRPVVQLGVEANATEELGNAWDLPAAPAAGNAVSVSLVDPNTAYPGLERDIRAVLNGSLWQLAVRAGPQLDVVLDWDAAMLPPGGLQLWPLSTAGGEPVGEAVSLAATSRLVVPAGTQQFYGIGLVSAFVVAPAAPTVPEGGTRPLSVRLARQPAGPVTAALVKVSGDEDLSVPAGTILTFTPDDWNRDHVVTISAAEDNGDTLAGSALFRLNRTSGSVPLAAVDFTAAEVDDDIRLTLAVNGAGGIAPAGVVLVDRDAMPFRIEALENQGEVFAGWSSVPAGVVAAPGAKITTVTSAVDALVTANFGAAIGIMAAAPGEALGTGTGTVEIREAQEVRESGSLRFTVTPTGGRPPYSYTWRLGQVTVGNAPEFVYAPDYSTVAHPSRSADQVLTCTVSDSVARAAASVTWRVLRVLDADRPPTVPGVSIRPDLPGTLDPLVATVDAAAVDPDGDAVQYAAEWTRNGAPTAETGLTVAAARTRKGEQWRVGVRAVTQPYAPDGVPVAGAAGEAAVTIQNSVPAASVPACLGVVKNGSLTVVLEGVDADVQDGMDTLTYTITEAPGHGRIDQPRAVAGTVTYVPAAGFAGIDRFRFTVGDGTATSAPVTATVLVSSDWLLTLTAAGSIAGRVQLGVTQGATPGADDTDLDLPAEPHAAIVLLGGTDPQLRELSRDMRGQSAGSRWLLEVTTGTTEAVVSWDRAAVPASGLALWRLTAATGTEVPGSRLDMATAAAAEVRIPAGATYCLAIGSRLVTVNLELLQGWNLISLPIEPLDRALAAVFADPVLAAPVRTELADGRGGVVYSGGVWSWDTTQPGTNKYVSVTELRALTGYWVWVNRRLTLPVTGTPAASTATNLVRGWNLLGPARSVGLPQHASILNTLWWWDGQEYQLAAELLPGRGYWIYAATETVPVDLGQ